MTSTVIPTVSLAELSKSENRNEAAKTLGEAFNEHGFVYIKDHGLEELSATVLSEAQKCFNLPQEIKNEMRQVDSYRGYFKFKEEQTNFQDDWKEGIYFFNEELFIPDGTQESVFAGSSNSWPNKKQLPNFQDVVSTYFRKVVELGYTLLGGLSLSLGLDEDFFKTKFSDQSLFQLAVLHYYPKNEEALASDKEQVWGVGEHTDYGVLTILLQDDVGGLQAQTKDGKWIDVPPQPGSFIINLGDMLEMWTNGVFKAPNHRVKVSPTTHRFSIAMFFEPSVDCIISPISVENALFTIKDGGSNRHGGKLPLRYGDYVLAKYRKNFPNVKKISN